MTNLDVLIDICDFSVAQTYSLFVFVTSLDDKAWLDKLMDEG